MKLTLVPRAAPASRLRVWIGVQASAAPALNWTLGGAPANPVYLRQLQSAIPADLLGGKPASYFTAVVEFSGLTPATPYQVGVTSSAGDAAELRTRTLPLSIPNAFEKPFNVLLASCFHQYEDKGQVAAAMGGISGPRSPDLTLLMGDQVYLDLPTLKDFPPGAPELARKFEADYRLNWQSDTAYLPLLRAAPTASLPDDHEFWNNFPHKSPIIQNSWTDAGRKSWKEAATALYEAFQFAHEPATYHLGGPQQLGDAQVIAVDPLSFFLADGRSLRDFGKASVFTARGMQQLRAWVAETVAQRKIGVFVTGQSLLDERASKTEGFFADFTMPNYGDFKAVADTLGQLPAAGLPLVLLTGDVHWGRVAKADNAHTAATVVEVISSPASLVSTVGKDDWKRIWGSLTGRQDPWPRHSDAAMAPEFLWKESFGQTFTCKRVHAQKGNHVALLSFSRAGAGVRLLVTYQPIHESAAVRRNVQTVEIPLTPR